MWIKNKKINLLEKSIEKLTKMLQEGNFVVQKIVTLNIPIIGEYVADIVDIVERSR